MLPVFEGCRGYCKVLGYVLESLLAGSNSWFGETKSQELLKRNKYILQKELCDF